MMKNSKSVYKISSSSNSSNSKRMINWLCLGWKEVATLEWVQWVSSRLESMGAAVAAVEVNQPINNPVLSFLEPISLWVIWLRTSLDSRIILPRRVLLSWHQLTFWATIMLWTVNINSWMGLNGWMEGIIWVNYAGVIYSLNDCSELMIFVLF